MKVEEVLPEGKKRCSKCIKVLDLSDFSPSLRKRKTAWCKLCRRGFSSELPYAQRAPERRRVITRNNRIANALKKYGAPSLDFAELVRNQNGRCAACESVLDLVPNASPGNEANPTNGEAAPRSPHIDHDHKTKEYRGILCQRCNMGMGLLGDDIPGVAKALLYLIRHEITKDAGFYFTALFDSLDDQIQRWADLRT